MIIGMKEWLTAIGCFARTARQSVVVVVSSSSSSFDIADIFFYVYLFSISIINGMKYRCVVRVRKRCRCSCLFVVDEQNEISVMNKTSHGTRTVTMEECLLIFPSCCLSSIFSYLTEPDLPNGACCFVVPVVHCSSVSVSSGYEQKNVIIQRDRFGYGLTVSGDNPVYVLSVREGGAAHRAGINTNDQIIKVSNVGHPSEEKYLVDDPFFSRRRLGRSRLRRIIERD